MFLCGPIFVPVVTNSHATFLPGGKAANQRFFAEHGGWWLGGEAGGLSQCEERAVIDCYTPIVMLPGRTTVQLEKGPSEGLQTRRRPILGPSPG